MSFPLRMSSVKVTTEEILNGKIHFLCSDGVEIWAFDANRGILK